MSVKTYKIRKSFLVPLSIDSALLFVLLVISFLTKSHPTEKIVLFIIFLPLLYVLIEVIYRETRVDGRGIEIKKFMRKKVLEWEHITNVDTMVLRKKVYLTLTTTRGFYIVSNSYENFSGMVADIVEHLSSEKVEERVRDIIKNPIRKVSDIVGAWISALLLFAIIYFKLVVF